MTEAIAGATPEGRDNTTMATEPTTKQAAPEFEYQTLPDGTIAPVCPECKHAGDLNRFGVCKTESYHRDEGEWLPCQHRCDVPPAIQPATVSPTIAPTAEWQPIESAPKDGEDVLLWVPAEEGFDIAYWRDDANAWDTYEGWIQSEPSHWMRPQPPSALQRRQPTIGEAIERVIDYLTDRARKIQQMNGGCGTPEHTRAISFLREVLAGSKPFPRLQDVSALQRKGSGEESREMDAWGTGFGIDNLGVHRVTPAPTAEATCEWKPRHDDFLTQCGESSSANGYKFCPFCGKEIK